MRPTAPTTTCLAVILLILSSQGRLGAQPWEVHRPVGDAEVIERYREILHADPTSVRGLEGLLSEYAPHGGLEALVEDYAQRLASEPDSPAMHVILARLRERAEQPQAALTLIDRAIALGFDNSAGYILRGRLRGQLGDPEGAAADFELALDRVDVAEERVDVLRALGDLQLALGRRAEALRTYARIAEEAPRDRYIRQELASILYEAGFREEALERYREVVALAGTNTRDRATALSEVALLEEELQRYEDALASWRRIREMTAEGNWLRHEAETGLLRTYRVWGRLDLLLAELEAGLTARTRDPFVLYNRARVLLELGRGPEAVAAYRLAVERRPNDPAIRRELAAVLIDLGHGEEAQDVLEAAIERWPEQVELAIALAGHFVDRGQLFDASFVLRTHQEAAWDDGSLLWDVLELYRRIGDRDAAQRVTRRLLELRPDDTRPVIVGAEEAFERNDVVAALTALEPLLESDDPAVLLQLFDLLQRHGQHLRATGLIWEGRSRFPDDDDIALAWLRVLPPADAEATLGAAREVLLQADTWEVVAEAFSLYVELIGEADLLGWARGYFQARFDTAPNDYRAGRLALMLHILDGDSRQAARTLQMLEVVTPADRDPALWVTATLERWPSPGALPLLRRLAASDPAARWRYEILGARLLVAGGRPEEAIGALDSVRRTSDGNPLALFGIGEVMVTMSEQAQRAEGCAVIQEALALEPRNLQFRLGAVDCLSELGRADAAYEVARDGFERLREVAAADALFERLLRVIPKWLTVDQVAAELRAIMADARPELSEWLAQRLEAWLP